MCVMILTSHSTNAQLRLHNGYCRHTQPTAHTMAVALSKRRAREPACAASVTALCQRGMVAHIDGYHAQPMRGSSPHRQHCCIAQSSQHGCCLHGSKRWLPPSHSNNVQSVAAHARNGCRHRSQPLQLMSLRVQRALVPTAGYCVHGCRQHGMAIAAVCSNRQSPLHDCRWRCITFAMAIAVTLHRCAVGGLARSMAQCLRHGYCLHGSTLVMAIAVSSHSTQRATCEFARVAGA